MNDAETSFLNICQPWTHPNHSYV